MHIDQLKEAFFTLVAPDVPNDWDVEERLEPLLDVDEETIQTIFQYIPTLWPVSNALCYDYLNQAKDALSCLKPSQLGEWVNKTLDQYETDGLRAAQRFMTNVEDNFLCLLRGEAGLRFEQIQGKLLPYVRGLAGTDIDLKPADTLYTDTTTIFIPYEITTYRTEEENFLLYKLIISFQWGFIACNSLTVHPKAFTRSDELGTKAAHSSSLAWFLHSFSRPELSRDIYHLLETARISAFLTRELPGLMRSTKELREKRIPTSHYHSDSGRILVLLQQHILGVRKHIREEKTRQAFQILEKCCLPDSDVSTSITATGQLYDVLAGDNQPYTEILPLVFQGVLRLGEVEKARIQRREEQKELFIDTLATHLLILPPSLLEQIEKAAANSEDNSNTTAGDQAMIVQQDKTAAKDSQEKNPIFITINTMSLT